MDLKREISKLDIMAADMVGVPTGKVKKKTTELVLARLLVANVLMDYKVTPAQIARHYPQDRTTFNVYRKKHEEYMQNPRLYPEYNFYYKQLLDGYKLLQSGASSLGKVATLDELEQRIDELQAKRVSLLKSM